MVRFTFQPGTPATTPANPDERSAPRPAVADEPRVDLRAFFATEKDSFVRGNFEKFARPNLPHLAKRGETVEGVDQSQE